MLVHLVLPLNREAGARMKPSKARDELELVTEALAEARRKLLKVLDDNPNINRTVAQAKRQVEILTSSLLNYSLCAIE
jgi:hypothetical protein